MHPVTTSTTISVITSGERAPPPPPPEVDSVEAGGAPRGWGGGRGHRIKRCPRPCHAGTSFYSHLPTSRSMQFPWLPPCFSSAPRALEAADRAANAAAGDTEQLRLLLLLPHCFCPSSSPRDTEVVGAYSCHVLDGRSCPWSRSPLASVRQQTAQLFLVQPVSGHDVFQLLPVACQVMHEVGHSGLFQHPMGSQKVYVLIGHLQGGTQAFRSCIQVACPLLQPPLSKTTAQPTPINFNPGFQLLLVSLPWDISQSP